MRRVWIGCACALGLGCATPRATTPRQPRPPEPSALRSDPLASFEAARARGPLDAEFCQEIVDELESRLRATADRVHRFNVGVVWQTCGEDSRARGAYSSIGEEDPRFAAAQNNLGVLVSREGDRAGAIDRFERALAIEPSLTSARANLGAMHRAQYREARELAAFDAAQSQFQAILMEEPRDLRALEGLAGLYYDRASFGEPSYAVLAYAVTAQARRLEGDGGAPSATLRNLEGLLALLDGRTMRALRAFEDAIAQDPTAAGPRLNAAHVLLQVRAYRKAAKHLALASKMVEGEAAVGVALGRGVAATGAGDLDGAKEAYARAAELDSTDPRVDYNLGLFYQRRFEFATEGFDLEDLHRARDHLERFVQRAGDDPRHAETVVRARRHVAAIEASLRPSHPAPNPDVERLEALYREQRAKERVRLLELERRAKAAWDTRHPAEE